MKKILVIFGIIATFFLITFPVYAQYGLTETANKTPYSTNTDVYTITEKIVSGALAALAFIFFGLTLYAGVRWMTARGDESYVEKAKDTLRAAITGLVITLAAYALTRFIFQRLNNSGSTTVTTPTTFLQTNYSKIS